MEINQRLPEFRADAYHQGTFRTITHEDLLGRWAVLFFYPADFTFVCPTELADLGERYAELQAMGVEVCSISTDTHFTHMAWHDTSPSIGKLTFPMLADPTGHLSRTFGVLVAETGLASRGTFVVNPEGLVKIIEVTDDGIGRNARELVRKIQAAQFVAEHPGEACPARWTPGAATLKPGPDLVGKI
ncbi:MAG: alkyl hydroperoxide reductase subunit C [Candidatus Sericytochromatia bacterium]|nr:alkyl hydroperoxide reductase subunit C [Candidatus Sericytochromatia bacterium]